MLTYFPKPFPDESLYSLLGRYHLNTCGKSLRKTLLQLLGNSSVRYSHCFPTHIQHIVNITKSIIGWEASTILHEHTLWPYFFSFSLDQEMKSHLELIYSASQGVKRSAGISGQELNPFPKYCPGCNRINNEKYREIFWNRVHQIPGIKICPIHNCFLETIDLTNYDGDISLPVYPPDIKICKGKEARPNKSIILYEIALKCTKLLYGQERLDLNHKERLTKIGFTEGKKVKTLKLMGSFDAFFEAETPGLFPKGEEFISSGFIVGARRKSDAFVHVLFDYYISKQPIIPTKSPFWDLEYFGKGPWPCLNKSCPKFGMKVIQKGKFVYTPYRGKTVTHFSCTCGMTYSQSHKIKDGKSLDTTTLKRFKSPARPVAKLPSRTEVKLKQELFWSLHSSGQKDLKNYNAITQTNTWLKKHDKVWYVNQKAKLKTIKSKLLEEKKTKVEGSLMGQLYSTRRKLIHSNPKFRVSRNVVLKMAGIHLSQITKSMDEYLSSWEETEKDFRNRRLRQIAEFLKEDGQELNRTKLLSKFHCRFRKELIPEVDHLLRNCQKILPFSCKD